MNLSPTSPQPSEIISRSSSSHSQYQPATVTPGAMKDERIDIPVENDVLCGRGGSINSHKGNENFRELVEKRKRVYLTARFKREKRLIAASIVSEIRGMDPSGRFLARKGGKDNGYWYDIGDEKARDKTSQALRENAPSIRAEIETEINQQRREMKLQEDAELPKQTNGIGNGNGNAASTPPPYPPPPGPPQYYSQQYWDWYYHYYGYAHPHPPPPPHYAHASPGASPPPRPLPHPATQPPPGSYHWRATPGSAASPSPVRSHEEFKEGCSPTNSQEEVDRRMAQALQYQENADAFEARKRRHQSADSRATRSNVSVTPGGNPKFPVAHAAKHAKIVNSCPFDEKNNKPMSQEEKDHRLAVALQEQEDGALRHQLKTAGDSSRSTSRSNAYSQVQRANRGAMSYDNTTSFMAWTMGSSEPASDTAQKPKAVERPKNPLAPFMVDNEDIIIPPPQAGRDMAYSPINLSRDNSALSADPHHQQLQQENSSSLFSLVANHILGSTMESWDISGNTDSSGGRRVRTAQPSPASSRRKPSPCDDTYMEMEGQEVQLMDVRDESSMPPPEPRVQIDWPSRVGSCHTWIPETLGTSTFCAPTRQSSGISLVGSLEMDGSANELSCNGSIGGGSLCHVFKDEDDMMMHRALREVPSWERSMRSKSPLSIGSIDEEDDSMIRVRGMEKPPMTPIVDNEQDVDVDMDWEEHPEHS